MSNGLHEEHESAMEMTPEVPQVIEEGTALPSLLTPDFVDQFEKGVEVYKRFVSVCFRLTTESHWINHGTTEKPTYSIQGPGAEALMNPLGINFERPEVRLEYIEDADGKFYRYWVEGYMESATLRRRGYYYGYCDSRDQFFNARKGWRPETGHGDIKKAAYTNWLVNGVTRMAGLRNPSEELLKAAGLNIEKIQKIEYREHKGSPEAPPDLNPGTYNATLLNWTESPGERKPHMVELQIGEKRYKLSAWSHFNLPKHEDGSLEIQNLGVQVALAERKSGGKTYLNIAKILPLEPGSEG